MDAVNELVRILDREAVVIEHVLFRLKAIDLLLASDGHRFLSHATEELDEALDRLGALETLRALSVEEVGEALGTEAGTVVLSEVLRLADERQRGQLLRAQVRLRDLLRQLEEQTAVARDLALARVAAVRAALERLRGTPGPRYGQDGITRSGGGWTGPGRGSYDERL